MQADLGIMVLQHVDPFTNLLERPGRLGPARLFRGLSHNPVAFAGRADAHQLLMGTVATVAAVTAGAQVVHRLKGIAGCQDLINATITICCWETVYVCTWSSILWICSLISWMSESTIFPPWNASAAKTSSFTGPLKNQNTRVRNPARYRTTSHH